jgi:hypothetical protein
MPFSYKVLGQVNPVAVTATTLYTVPAGKSAVVSSITICNQSASSTQIRIAIRPAAEALATKHYIAYDTVIAGNDLLTIAIGITLATTDVVTVYAGISSVSFNLFGSEIT